MTRHTNRSHPLRAIAARSAALLLAAFAAPSGAAEDGVSAAYPAHPPTAAVELDAIGSGHLLVAATLGGRDASLLVDTGAESTIVPPAVRERFGVDAQVLETIAAAGVGGPLTSTRHAAPAFGLGESEFDLPAFHVAPIGPVLAGLGRIAGGDVHGILGQDALLAHSALLDVGSNRLVLREGADLRDPGLGARLGALGYAAVPLTRIDNGFHLVTVDLDGRTLRLILDSGARLTIVHAERLGADARTRAAGSVGAAGGSAQAALSELPVQHWSAGEVVLAPEVVGVIDLTPVVASALERGGAEIDGVLGLDVLREHGAIIDLGADVLYLTEAPTPALFGQR